MTIALYIVLNLILLIISLTMIKSWGIKLLPTFVSIFFLYCCAATFYDSDVELIQIKILCNVIVLLPSTLLILISLKRQNNIQILKEIKLLIVVIVSIVSSIILSLFYKKDSIFIFKTLFIGPIYESLFFHEIVFKLVKKEYELKKKIFAFFILSLLIGFSHGSLEILALCSRIIGFFLLYLIRLKWNENSKFWYVVLIHFAYNLLLIIYGIMKIGV